MEKFVQKSFLALFCDVLDFWECDFEGIVPSEAIVVAGDKMQHDLRRHDWFQRMQLSGS